MLAKTPTLMEQESQESFSRIEKQLLSNDAIIRNICKQIKKKNPKFIVTIGRGSSDHACTFAKYVFETKLHTITASSAPSIVTLYHAPLDMSEALVIGISQSGKSPDLSEMMEEAKKTNALTIALVNQIDSPLAKIAEFTIPLCAGEEKAVAATKSYIASLSAIAHLTAHLTNDYELVEALTLLPKTLKAALTCDWTSAINLLQNAEQALIIGRGYGFPVAQEAALKLKETCAIQAEAFSAAEVLHGPFALIKKDYPFFLFAQNDQTLKGILDLTRKIDQLDGSPMLAVASNLAIFDNYPDIAQFTLHLPKSIHPILDPIVAIQVFYIMTARLAVLRGHNPDAPLHLKKVTETR